MAFSFSSSTMLVSSSIELLIVTLLLFINPTTIDSFAPITHIGTARTRNTHTLSTYEQKDSIFRSWTNNKDNSHANRRTNRGDVQVFIFKRLFGGQGQGQKDNKNDENENETKVSSVNDNDNADVIQQSPSKVTEESTQSPTKQLSALEQAQLLRAQAERARLEAEKMDIMLTLQKIEKLELELEKSGDINNNTNSNNDEKKKKRNQDEIKTQIEVLKKKLNGDSSDQNQTTNNRHKDNEQSGESQQHQQLQQSSTITTANNSDSDSTVSKNNVDSTILSVIEEAKKNPQELKPPTSLTTEELESRIQKFNDAPMFMKELVVNAAGMQMDNLNTTALILKLDNDESVYKEQQLPNKEKAVPNFSQEQIDEVVEAVKFVPQFVKNLYGDEIKNNDTAIALLMLEDEWKEGKIIEMPEITQQMIDNKLEEVKWVPQFLRGDNDTELALQLIKMDFKNNPRKFRAEVLGESETMKTDSTSMGEDKSSSNDEGFFSSSLFGGSENLEKTAADSLVENLFPKTIRRQGEEPSENELKVAIAEVFAKDNTWTISQPPDKVPGGFIIRGYTKYETGKELMEAIYKNLERSKLGEKLSVFYIFDPTPVTEEQMNDGERPPVLFVTAPKVVRDPEPIQRSIISSLALGFVWYNSLIPYLLNDKYMKLADEQLALADASMPANLDFLNDVSFPLFASILGIQVAHEIAHAVAAKLNGIEISFPTLVPSLESGLTGAITSLQSPPKDKQSLFDFAIAGPLTGILVSVILMYTGMFLSSSMDSAAFSDLPALPLDLLRQSSLGCGIINSVTPGLLSIPDAAIGTKALSDINIPLHPLTIAGYLGLMINAINLLPLGRTDGGRISLTLFGRSGTQLVNLITFIGLFFGGVMGSDFFLLFFSYVIFFQSEPEIPQQNEVDDMEFSRVILATATGVLTLLALIPM